MPRLFFIVFCCLFGTNIHSKTAYTNFSWIDPIKETTNPNMMLIEDHGQIIYMGPVKAYDESMQNIDLKGKYVISGFIDTHTHVTLGAVEIVQQDGEVKLVANNSDEIAKHNGKVLLAHGITDVRNPGGAAVESIRYKSQVRAGNWLGPDAYVAGELLDANAFEGLAQAVNSADEIDGLISAQKAQGVDFIKLYTGLDEGLLEAGIKSAHQHGLKAVAHLEEVPWDKAALMGIDGIVHAMPVSLDLVVGKNKDEFLKQRRPGAFAFFEWYEAIDFNTPRFQSFVQTLKEQGTSIDPTLIVFHNAFWGDQPEVIKHPKLDLTHPELVNNWQTFYTFNIGWAPVDFKRAKAVWPKVQQFIQILDKAGIHMTVGSDMNNPWVIPGVSFHQEMQLLVDAGISNYKVLKMATWHGSQAIDQSKMKGSLEEGKYANFVVLKDNPVNDIKHTQSIYAVVKSGQMYKPNELIEGVQKTKELL